MIAVRIATACAVAAALLLAGFAGSARTPLTGSGGFRPPALLPRVASFATGDGHASAAEISSFDVSGRGTATLVPGGPLVPVELVFTNSGSRPITVTSVRTRVAGTSKEGCGGGNFAVARQLNTRPVVPAGASRSLADLGVPASRWPQLRMLDAGNQNACAGATIDLRFSAQAKS